MKKIINTIFFGHIVIVSKINPTLWRFGDNPLRIDRDVYDRFE